MNFLLKAHTTKMFATTSLASLLVTGITQIQAKAVVVDTAVQLTYTDNNTYDFKIVEEVAATTVGGTTSTDLTQNFWWSSTAFDGTTSQVNDVTQFLANSSFYTTLVQGAGSPGNYAYIASNLSATANNLIYVDQIYQQAGGTQVQTQNGGVNDVRTPTYYVVATKKLPEPSGIGGALVASLGVLVGVVARRKFTLANKADFSSTTK